MFNMNTSAHQIALSAAAFESRSYHFASQNVLLSDTGPSHFGVAGSDRIYLVYEQAGRIDIYKFNDAQLARAKHYEVDENGDEVVVMSDQSTGGQSDKDEFVLERTIKLHDVDIVQVVYCQIVPEYFAFLVKSRATQQRAVRVYSNHLSELKELDSFQMRLNGELISTLSASTDYAVPPHLEKIDSLLNIIEFGHSDIGSLANYVHSCPVTGNLVISIANGTTLMYRYTRCILPSNKHHVAIDFVHIKTITVLDGWTPEVVKLSLNYLALMGQSHFSVLHLVLTDQPEYYDYGCHELEVKHDPTFKVSQECQVIYSRLFDQARPQESIFDMTKHRQQAHADTVWGPVRESLSCKFAVFDHNQGKTSESPFSLLVCRNLKLTSTKQSQNSRRQKGTSTPSSSPSSAHPSSPQQPETKLHPNELTSLRAKGKLTTDQMESNSNSNGSSSSSPTESKVALFGFDILPYRDQRSGLIFAHALYVLWDGQLNCYLIDLRRDKLRLVPISQLDLSAQSTAATKDMTGQAESPSSSSHERTKTVVIRDFSASPHEDLVHILTDKSLDTYATQFFHFLVSEEPEDLHCARPVAPLYQVSSNMFFNIIATLSSPEFVFLISRELGAQHTIYNLRRPSIDHLQADILSTLDDIKSNSDDDECPYNKHSLHRLYLQLHSVTKFSYLYPTRSYSIGGPSCGSSRIEQLQAFHRKIQGEIDDILRQSPTCDQAKCSFVARKPSSSQ